MTASHKLRVRVNGGVWQTGGITAAAGDTIELSPDNTVGILSYRYEIFDYPEGYALPAGWFDDGDGVYYSSAATPPSFALDAVEWGKYGLRFIVNGGVSEQIVGRTTIVAADPTLIDEETDISVPSPGGLVGLMQRETNQFGGKDWTLQYNRDMKAIAAAAAVPSGSAAGQALVWSGAAWAAGAVDLADSDAVTGILGVANGGTGIGLGAANTVLHVNAGGTAIESTLLTTSNLSGTAGILGSQLSASAGIVGTQLSASAAIAASQLADDAAGTVLAGGSPNAFTADPTVSSITAETDAAAAHVTAKAHVTAADGAVFRGYKSRGSAATPTIVADADVASQWDGYVYDGTGYHYSYAMRFVVADATPAAGDIGMGLEVHLDAGGGAGYARRLNVYPTAGVFTWDFQAGNITTTGTLNVTNRLSLDSDSGDYIALGANPADSGAVRLSHAMGAYGELNTPGTDSAIWTWGVVANDTAAFGDTANATQINGSTVNITGTSVELNGASATMLEAVEIAAGRRVVSLCLGADLTTTEMPAGTGDRVVAVATCATAPTNGGEGVGIIYVDADGNFWTVNEADVFTQLTP